MLLHVSHVQSMNFLGARRFRKLIFQDIERFINVESVLDRVVYDLDAVVAMAGPTYTTEYSNQSNRDKQR